ncbi:MAG: YraN family protein [Xanthomonadales bacterium]|nr:YraN family protein [Xanthomonadales bacterium]
MSTRTTGLQFEAIARQHLEQAGLVFVAANVNYPFGELDLVMRDGQIRVFVEVRYRKHSGFGGGVQSVTASKRRRIAHAASAWLAANPADARHPCRFDVVALSGAHPDTTIEWLRAAFTLDDLS